MYLALGAGDEEGLEEEWNASRGNSMAYGSPRKRLERRRWYLRRRIRVLGGEPPECPWPNAKRSAEDLGQEIEELLVKRVDMAGLDRRRASKRIEALRKKQRRRMVAI